jgi:hypothetical protein
MKPNNSKDRILEKLQELTSFVSSVEVNFYITEAQHDQLIKQLELVNENCMKYRNRAFNAEQELEKVKDRLDWLVAVVKVNGWWNEDWDLGE